jgi:hypothetical protein
LDAAVAQIQLDCPGVLPIVGRLVAGGVAPHVRVNREGDPASRQARPTILCMAAIMSGALRSLTNT